nr:MAG TPA: hypothetical protein [Caudoviricetes sp.]
MRYMYKQTGLIVESGIKLDSILFQELSEESMEPEATEDIVEDVGIQEEAVIETKPRTASRKKNTTSQKK